MFTAMKYAVALKSAAALLAAAVVAGHVGVASAQQYSYGYYELAPGFGGPNQYVDYGEREVLDGYGLVDGELPDTNIVDTGDGALTEFAGQKRNFDPGIVGGLLGSVKRSIIGQDSDPLR